MSFLSTQYGWAANNVVNFEVVLANGTVVNANAKENTGKEASFLNTIRVHTDI
jgi:FAD/FMN-containing dehydrogenase